MDDSCLQILNSSTDHAALQEQNSPSTSLCYARKSIGIQALQRLRYRSALQNMERIAIYYLLLGMDGGDI